MGTPVARSETVELSGMHLFMCGLQSMERLKEASYEDRHRVEKAYKEKLRAMDGRIKAVRDKERRLAQVERLQQRSLEKCARLQAEIQATKTQKVLGRPFCMPSTFPAEVGDQTDPRGSRCPHSSATQPAQPSNSLHMLRDGRRFAGAGAAGAPDGAEREGLCGLAQEPRARGRAAQAPGPQAGRAGARAPL